MLVARRVTKKFQFESPNCLLGCTRYVVSRFIVQDQPPSSKHHRLFMWTGSPELRSSMWHYWLHQTFANTEAVAIDIRISIHGQRKHACWWHVLKDEIRALQLYYAIVKWHSFPIFYDNLSVQFLRGWPLKVGPLGWPGTLIRHYYSTASNIPRHRGSHQYGGGCLNLKRFLLQNGRYTSVTWMYDLCNMEMNQQNAQILVTTLYFRMLDMFRTLSSPSSGAILYIYLYSVAPEGN